MNMRRVMVTLLGSYSFLWNIAASAVEYVPDDGIRRAPVIPLTPTGMTRENFYSLVFLFLLIVLFAMWGLFRRRKDRHKAGEQGRKNALAQFAAKGVSDAWIASAKTWFEAHPEVDAEYASRVVAAFDRTIGVEWIRLYSLEKVKEVRKMVFEVNDFVSTSHNRSFGKTIALDASRVAQGLKKKETSLSGGGHSTGLATNAESVRKMPELRVDTILQESSCPWLRPGRSVELRVRGKNSVAGIIMRSLPNRLDLALPRDTRMVVSEEVELRFDLGRALCSVVGKVEEIAYGTAPMVRVSGFLEVWSTRRRMGERIPIAKSVDFGHYSAAGMDNADLEGVRQAMEPNLQGFLEDLNLGGCCLMITDGHYENGDFIQLSFSDDNGRDVRLLGTVVGISRGKDGKEMRLHIQFFPLDEDTARVLVRKTRSWVQNIYQYKE